MRVNNSSSTVTFGKKEKAEEYNRVGCKTKKKLIITGIWQSLCPLC